MTSKISLAALAAAFALCLAGCGSTPCSEAEDLKAECLMKNSSSSGAPDIQAPNYECSGVYECQSQCVLDSGCDKINNGDANYIACLQKCK